MKLLKIGLSGVRGIVGESLTPKTIMDFAAAFGAFAEGRPVVLGRDTRVHGPMLRAACVSALLSAGCDVIDLGDLSHAHPAACGARTWAPAAASRSRRATTTSAGTPWPSSTPRGPRLNPFQGTEVLDIYHVGTLPQRRHGRPGRSVDGLGRRRDAYFKALFRFLDAEAVGRARLQGRHRRLHGAGAPFLGVSPRGLGFDLIPINDEPNGFFPARSRAAAAQRPAGRLRPQGHRRGRRLPAEQRRQPGLAGQRDGREPVRGVHLPAGRGRRPGAGGRARS